MQVAWMELDLVLPNEFWLKSLGSVYSLLGHSVNLAVNDAMKTSKLIHFLEVTYEMMKLIKCSSIAKKYFVR